MRFGMVFFTNSASESLSQIRIIALILFQTIGLSYGLQQMKLLLFTIPKLQQRTIIIILYVKHYQSHDQFYLEVLKIFNNNVKTSYSHLNIS